MAAVASPSLSTVLYSVENMKKVFDEKLLPLLHMMPVVEHIGMSCDSYSDVPYSDIPYVLLRTHTTNP